MSATTRNNDALVVRGLCESLQSARIRPRDGGAFSLVEVLVVIVIVALVAGMVIPAVQRARASAKRTVCLTQVRGTLSAIHVYAVDHNGSIPYGPTAPPPSPSNLYPVTGLVTSQLSLNDGRPVGLGLLLSSYLGNQPAILFCPDPDQRVDAKKELANVGKWRAISGYYYRHGSNTLLTRTEPHDTWDDHIILEDLGENHDGKPIRALIVDQNFLNSAHFPGIIDRTNHKRRWVNAGYADGHAISLRNIEDRLTVNVGSFLYNGAEKILDVFELLDVEY